MFRIRKGGDPSEQGTWIHSRLAIDFARWLNVDFVVWCNGQIELRLRETPLKTGEQPSGIYHINPLRRKAGRG